MKLNGWQRLWVVLSILYLVPFFIIYIKEEKKLHRPPFVYRDLDLQPVVTAGDQVWLAVGILFLWLLACAGTYAVVWTVARTIRWVYRGFKKS